MTAASAHPAALKPSSGFALEAAYAQTRQFYLANGFTPLEVLCAVVVLTLAAMGFSQALIGGLRLAQATRERALAIEQARRVLEEMQDASFAQVFALYGFGTAPGPNFAVTGLTLLDDDADGFVGSISFPVNGAQLRENLALSSLGMPHDLNGDGAIDAANHAADYKLLPVLVSVSWRGPSAPMRVELRTILSQR